MRILQVNNLANVCGGTGGCALSITKALDEDEHHVYFYSGRVTDALEKEFGDATVHHKKQRPLDHAFIDEIKPDVIIFNNTPEPRFPHDIPLGPITIFYQHSAAGSCRGPRLECDIALGVSKYLCKTALLDDEWYLYQPVHMANKPRRTSPEGQLRIGRICTPNSAKWVESELTPLYDFLARSHQNVMWEFVGCPGDMVEPIRKACQGRAKFITPSTGARDLYYEWDAMLYSGKLLESYGRTVCEAQMAGCVPIVSNHSGFAEQINHGADGFLCDRDEDFDWAVKMVHDPERLTELRVHAMSAGKTRGDLGLWKRTFGNWIKAIKDDRAANQIPT